jgi:hypothetical protein
LATFRPVLVHVLNPKFKIVTNPNPNTITNLKHNE